LFIRRFITCLPIIGFLAFVFIAWKYFEHEKIWLYLKLVDLWLIILVILLTSTQILTATLRYNFFLKACGTKIKIKDCMHAVLTALSINSVVPGKGGDFAKAIVLSKNRQDILKYTGVTIIEKLCDLIVLSVITFIGAFLAENNFWQLLSLASTILFISLFLSLRFIDKFPILGYKLKIFPDIVIIVFQNQKFFLKGFFFCILLWLVNITIIFLLLISVDAGVTLTKIISYWPSSMLTGMLPITISGFGTRDIAFQYALGQSIDNTRLFAGTFLYTAFVYWFLSLLAFIILGIKSIHKFHTS